MPPVLTAKALVATPLARRYLGQLCKHFEHKRPVTFDERQGRIEFGAGLCELGAEDGTLRLRVSAADAEALCAKREVSGMTTAQRLDNAGQPDMPASAIDTGCIE